MAEGMGGVRTPREVPPALNEQREAGEREMGAWVMLGPAL